MEHWTKTLKWKIGFLFRNKSCFSFLSQKYHCAVLTNFLKPPDAAFHAALRFITSIMDSTPIATSWMEGWTGLSLAVRREQHCLLFIFTALSDNFPPYLSISWGARQSQNLTRHATCEHRGSFQFFFIALLSATGHNPLRLCFSQEVHVCPYVFTLEFLLCLFLLMCCNF